MSRPSIRTDLAALEGYHSPQVDVEVRLNTNEAPAPPPAGFSDAVAAAATGIEWHRYPDRAACELRTAIGRLHHVGPDQVFCANGSNEVLQTVLLTFAGPGRTVLTFEPTYALHSHIARLTGATTVAADRTEDFLVDPAHAIEQIRVHEPAVTFLCSPNNPTGIVEPTNTIRRVLDAVADVGGLLVLDEAYGQFSPFAGETLLEDDVPLVVSRTYSKTWAMAAARIGYLLAPAWMVADLEKVVLPYHLDALKQAAGVAALQFLDEMEKRVSLIVEERGRIETALTEMGATVWPSGANFILFRPPAGNGDEVWARLVDASVLVRNTSSWDHLGGCLRVTVGTPDDNTRFLNAIRSIIESTA